MRNALRVSNVVARFPGRKIDQSGQETTLVRVEWTDSLSWMGLLSAWNNANFYLTEILRKSYDPNNLVYLDFREMPETEEEYNVRAEVVVQAPVSLQPVRSVLRPARARKLKKELKPKLTMDGLNLPEEDKQLLFRFNRLPLDKRIQFWQRHLAPSFR